jgi:hypothetical protein
MVSLCKWPIARYFMHRLCAFKQPETRACSKSCLNRVIGNVNGAEQFRGYFCPVLSCDFCAAALAAGGRRYEFRVASHEVRGRSRKEVIAQNSKSAAVFFAGETPLNPFGKRAAMVHDESRRGGPARKVPRRVQRAKSRIWPM